MDIAKFSHKVSVGIILVRVFVMEGSHIEFICIYV